MSHGMDPFDLSGSALQQSVTGDLTGSVFSADLFAQEHRPLVHGTIYEPQGFAPAYAYPLLIWFHDAGANESEMQDWVSQISQRNYVGLGLRGPRPTTDCWPIDDAGRSVPRTCAGWKTI